MTLSPNNSGIRQRRDIRWVRDAEVSFACGRKKLVTFILRLSMPIDFHLMVCMLSKQERESVPQASPSHHCQHCFQAEHTDAALVARVKQLLDEACQSLPILSPMGRLASCTPSSCVELSKKIPQLGRVKASRRVREAVVGQD